MSKVLDLDALSPVSSLSNADFLYAKHDGVLNPVSVANVRKALMAQAAWDDVNGGAWITVAKFTGSIGSCVLVATHGWGSGMPVPLVAAVSYYKDRPDAMHAEQLTKSDWFSNGLSFPSIRFANNGDATYLEIMLKKDARTSSIYTAIGMPVNMELVSPVKSTAAAADIWKTVSFGGVKRCLYLWKGGVRHESGNGVNTIDDSVDSWNGREIFCLSRNGDRCKPMHENGYLEPPFHGGEYTGGYIPKCSGLYSLLGHFREILHPSAVFSERITRRRLYSHEHRRRRRLEPVAADCGHYSLINSIGLPYSSKLLIISKRRKEVAA